MGINPSYAAIHSTDTNISSQNVTTLATIAGIEINLAVLTWNDDMMSIYKAYNPTSSQETQFIYVGASISIEVASSLIPEITLIRTPSGDASPTKIYFRSLTEQTVSQYTFVESDVGASFSFQLLDVSLVPQQTIPLGTVVLFPAFFAEIIPLAIAVNSIPTSAYLLPCDVDGSVSSTQADVANFASYLSNIITSGSTSIIPAYCDCVTNDNTLFNFGYWCEAEVSFNVTTPSAAPDTAGIISLSTVNLAVTRSPASEYPYTLTNVPTLSFMDADNLKLSVSISTSSDDNGVSFTFDPTDPSFYTSWSSPTTFAFFAHITWSDQMNITTPWRFISNCEESVIASMNPPCSSQNTLHCLLEFNDDDKSNVLSSCICDNSQFIDSSCRIFLQSKSITDTEWSSITDLTTPLNQDDSFRVAFSGSADEKVEISILSQTYSFWGGSDTQYSISYLCSDFVSWTRLEAQNSEEKSLDFQLDLDINLGTIIDVPLTFIIKPYEPLILSTSFTSPLTSFNINLSQTTAISTDALFSVFLAYSTTDTTVTPAVTTYSLLEPLYCIDASSNQQSKLIKSRFLAQTVSNAQCYLPLYLPPLDELIVIIQTVFTTTPPVDELSASWRYSAMANLELTTVSTTAPSTICLNLSSWDDLATLKSDIYAYPINSECSELSISTTSTTPTQTAEIKEAIIMQEKYIQAGIINKQCLPSCPTGLTLDSTCQRCICATDSCAKYTRVAQVYLNDEVFSSTSDNDISIINRYISQEYYIELATSFFADFLQIARTEAELAVYSAYYSSYFGLEEITVTPITAVLDKGAAQQLLIYITLAVDGTSLNTTQIDARFTALNTRLSEFETYSVSPRTTKSSEDVATLGSDSSYANTFSGQLFKAIKLPTGVSMYTTTIKPFLEMTALSNPQTWCYQQKSCTSDCSYAACPTTAVSAFADVTVIDDAKFWSTCDATAAAATEYTALNVTCVDIYNRVSITNPTWCAPGFVDTYPEYSKLPCFTPSDTTPTLSLIPTPELDQTTTNSRYIAWHYTGLADSFVLAYLSGVKTEYSQLLTDPTSTDMTEQPWPETYPILLGRYSAEGQFAQLDISSSLFESTATGNIYIVMEEYPSIRLNITDSLVISNVDLCDDWPCESDDELCFPPTGTCSCPDGMSYSSSGVCQNTCTDTCGLHGTCVRAFNSTLQKYASTCECSDGWSGISCEISESCPISLCFNHGWRLWNIDSKKCENTCSCFDSWSSTDNCATCSLRSTCSSTGTLNSSYTSCSSCKCRRGYSGTLCTTRAMYGTMIFSNTTSSTSNSTIVNYPMSSLLAQNTSTLTTLNISQSLSAMSLATLTTLQQDMALSLNIDSSRVSIQQIVQSDLEQVQIDFLDIDDDDNDDDQIDGGDGGGDGDGGDSYNDGDLISYLKIVNDSIIRRYNVTFLIQASSNEDASYSSSAATTTTTTTIFAHNNFHDSFLAMFPTATVPTSISDLYQAWSNVQSNLPSTPIGNTPATQDLGSVDNAANAYDPQCVASATVTCPDGTDPFTDDEDDTTEEPSSGNTNPFYPPGSGSSSSSKSATTTIIIVVVVVVGGGAAAIILLLILLCVLRSKELLCFAPSNDKSDELIDSMSGMNLNGRSRKGTNPQSNQNNMSKSSSTEMTMISNASTASLMSHNGSAHESTSRTNSVVTSVDASDENLPPDWEKVKHPVTGAVFYVNQKTLVSQTHSPNQEGVSIW